MTLCLRLLTREFAVFVGEFASAVEPAFDDGGEIFTAEFFEDGFAFEFVLFEDIIGEGIDGHDGEGEVFVGDIRAPVGGGVLLEEVVGGENKVVFVCPEEV